jgi:hypothetical protein
LSALPGCPGADSLGGIMEFVCYKARIKETLK